jgi:uncharacterized integral membrane protein
MQSLKRLLIVIIALALAAGVVFFTLENRNLTQLIFFGWQTPELPLALYVLSAFVIGLIIGPLASWWPHQRLRMRYNKQIKQLRACEKRIKELQESSTAEDRKALPHAESSKTP